MTEDNPTVFYCYRCGNRVKRAAGNCWYCGASNQRPVRPPRHCPFCGEEIARKAVKCPHCAEFLNGRGRPESEVSAPPQHVTFIIDKAVIQGDQPLMLEGGKPLPPDLSKLLSNRTARAIESNQPALIDQQGVKALPFSEKARSAAPAARGADAESAPPFVEAERIPPASPEEPDGRSGAVVRRESAPPAPVLKKAGGALARTAVSALSKLADRALGALEEKPASVDEGDGKKGPEGVVDAEEVEKYKICAVCGAEVLAEDNYCFHCGAVLRKFARTPRKPMKVLGDFPFTILILCTLLLGAMIYFLFAGDSLRGFTVGSLTLRDLLQGAFSLFCLILLVFAFFARRTGLSQIVVIVYLVVWALVSLIALITSGIE